MLFTNPTMRAVRHRVVTSLLVLVSATAVHAQNAPITLPDVSVTVGRTIRTIHAQTGYSIAYTGSVVDTTLRITYPSRYVSVAEALDGIVHVQPVKYVVRGRYIALVPDEEEPKPAAPLYRQRTEDVYRSVDPGENSAAPLPRPDKPVEPQVAFVEPEPVEYYSDYTRIESYGPFRKLLPRWAVKTNLLYGAGALTPNLAVEMGLTPKSTLELSGSYNAWNRDKKTLDDAKQLLHRMIRAEYRLWLCERYNGHFFGAHAFFAQYNISEHEIPLLFEKEYRYKGDAYGAGITYGYQLPLGKRWGLEFNLGVGFTYMTYDKFNCAICDRDGIKSDKVYFGPTRAGITLSFLLK